LPAPCSNLPLSLTIQLFLQFGDDLHGSLPIEAVRCHLSEGGGGLGVPP